MIMNAEGKPPEFDKESDAIFGMKTIDVSETENHKYLEEVTVHKEMSKERATYLSLLSQGQDVEIMKDITRLGASRFLYMFENSLYIITERVYMDFHFFAKAAQLANLSENEWNLAKCFITKFSLRALACLHDLGMLHRSITLLNMHITYTGRYQLCMSSHIC